MPRKRIDITGQVFGKLTVLEEAGQDVHKNYLWLCKCECGRLKTTRAASLNYGDTRSCGCLYGEYHTTHGDSHDKNRKRLYQTWANMKQRCSNPNSTQYSDYGGRGITVCEEWTEYVPFKEWALANGYVDHLIIDRMDNNGNYSPDNCRFVTRSESNKNRRGWAAT